LAVASVGTIERPNDDAPDHGAGAAREAAGSSAGAQGAGQPVAIVVAARDEGERIAATLAALWRAFPSAALLVADDGSRDGTARIASGAGASVVEAEGRRGKGEAMTAAARQALRQGRGEAHEVFLLCDGDLGDSAARLLPLV